MLVVVISIALYVRSAVRWGSTAEERAASMPGDCYLEGGPARRLRMTRAISISASIEQVWPWLAQMGRGAGWYSVELLDNGRKLSADHIVSWIGPPELGDAAAVGYVRNLEPKRALTWWMGGEHWLGATLRMVVDIALQSEARGTRLVIRVSGDAAGGTAWLVGSMFQFIDSVMAIAQLRGIKSRAERFGTRTEDPDRPETGERDQYQLFEVIYASGERAGVSGEEKAPRWRSHAIADGVLDAVDQVDTGS